MEADWELEIGGDAPVIEAYWSGFADLRTNPERVSELDECRELPGLANALVRLNAVDSAVWTCKTDVFAPERIDADEMEASREDAVHAISCYVDMLFRSDRIWDSLAKAERDCETLCAALRAKALTRCRVDIVIRKAMRGDREELGATVYLTACGRTLSDAKDRLGECLADFSEVVNRG